MMKWAFKRRDLGDQWMCWPVGYSYSWMGRFHRAEFPDKASANQWLHKSSCPDAVLVRILSPEESRKKAAAKALRELAEKIHVAATESSWAASIALSWASELAIADADALWPEGKRCKP